MGKMVRQPVWVADDGKQFKTEQEMLRYEGAQKYADYVDSYVEQIKFPKAMNDRARKAQRTRIRDTVMEYLAWADASAGKVEATG